MPRKHLRASRFVALGVLGACPALEPAARDDARVAPPPPPAVAIPLDAAPRFAFPPRWTAASAVLTAAWFPDATFDVTPGAAPADVVVTIRRDGEVIAVLLAADHRLVRMTFYVPGAQLVPSEADVGHSLGELAAAVPFPAEWTCAAATVGIACASGQRERSVTVAAAPPLADRRPVALAAVALATLRQPITSASVSWEGACAYSPTDCGPQVPWPTAPRPLGVARPGPTTR